MKCMVQSKTVSRENSGLTQEDICRISRATESALELATDQGAFLSYVKITQVVDILRADNL
jgi:hypothetical protein